MSSAKDNVLVLNTSTTNAHYIAAGSAGELAALGARLIKHGIGISMHIHTKASLGTTNAYLTPSEGALLFAGVLIDAMKWRETQAGD